MTVLQRAWLCRKRYARARAGVFCISCFVSQGRGCWFNLPRATSTLGGSASRMGGCRSVESSGACAGSVRARGWRPRASRARAPGCVAAFNVKNCMVNDFKGKIESDEQE